MRDCRNIRESVFARETTAIDREPLITIDI